MSTEKPGEMKFAKNEKPDTITFNAGAFKIGSDYLCLDFGELFLNHEKIKTIIFQYKEGKKYTYKKVENDD